MKRMEKMTKKPKDIRNKVLSFDTPLTFKAADPELEDSDLIIEGAASTIDKDRVGDIIKSEAWNEKALEAYKRNPIILAFHRHDRPIGKATEVKATKNGLQLKAKISKSAGDIYGLIKDNILSAFSVGFVVNDADYDVEKDIFLIKDVELLEVSVVSVPANPYTTFNVSKSFENSREFEEFKKSFIKEETPIEENIIMAEEKKVETKTENTPTVDVEALTAQIKAKLEEERKAEEAVKAAEDAKRIEMRSMVEELVKQATAAVAEERDNEVAELQKALKDREEEVAEIIRAQRTNKMSYSERSGPNDGLTTEEKDNLVVLNMLLRKDKGQRIEDTKYFKGLREKSNMEHWDTGVQTAWEEEFSTRVHNELRASLVVEQMFSTLPMSTPTMYMPVNPEAGYADWVTGGKGAAQDQRSVPNQNPDTRTGSAEDQQLRSISLTSKTLATKSYIGYEEEEDSMIPVMPLVRDALIRRMAQASDLCLMMGQSASATGMTGVGSGTSIEGLWDFKTSSVTSTDNGATTAVADETLTIEDMLNARKALLRHGLDTSKLAYFTDVKGYYELLTDADSTGNVTFQTMDKVGSVATLLTGQLGSIGGVPLIVSEAFPAHTANSAMACCVYLPNFLFGEQRGLRVEQSIDVEFQTKTLVATRRFDFQEIETNKGVHFIVHGAS